jgi:hypothetical protein
MGGFMNRFAWLVIASLMVGCVSGPQCASAASSLGSECKNGFDEAKAKIKGMSDPAKKQQALALEKGAFTDMKSGEYQNCLDKLKQINTLAQ